MSFKKFSVQNIYASQKTNRLNYAREQVPNVAMFIEYLVVGGGGGGGNFVGGVGWGQGGGGGFVAQSTISVKPTDTFTVTVAGGGAGGSSSTAGGQSAFGTITADGGFKGGNGLTIGNFGAGNVNAQILGGSGWFGGVGVNWNTFKVAGGSNAGNAGPGEPADWGRYYGAGFAYEGGGLVKDVDANTGGGGYPGRQGSAPVGGNGATGVVVLSYLNTFPNLTVGAGLTSNLNTTFRPGYKSYFFTGGTGTVTIN